MFFRDDSKVKQESEESILNFNQITRQLRPLVKLLQVEGAYSIVYDTKKNALENKNAIVGLENPYRLTSWKGAGVANLYSYVWKVVMVVSLITFQFNVFEFPYPVKLFGFTPAYFAYTKSVGKFSNDVALAITGCFKVLELIALQWNAYLFVRWLNDWNKFERDFNSCFSKSKTKFNFDIRKFGVITVAFYIGFQVFVWAMGGVYFATVMFECRVPYFSFAVLIIAMFALWGHQLTEDLKVFIILKTNLVAYEQIRCGIYKNKDIVDIDSSDVIRWRNLINIARQQTIILCGYLKSQQLLTVVEGILSCTLGLFHLISGFSEGDIFKLASGSLLGSTYYSTSIVLRLYLKILLAERIPGKELQMAVDIMEINGKCCDPATKVELKFLYEMLKRDTINMNLGNYCFLDKQLILKVGVQVVTYLIVVLQFQGTNKMGPKST